MDLTGLEATLRVYEGNLPTNAHPAFAGLEKYYREPIGALVFAKGGSRFGTEVGETIYKIPQKDTAYIRIGLCRFSNMASSLDDKGIIDVSVLVKNLVDGSHLEKTHAQVVSLLSSMPDCRTSFANLDIFSLFKEGFTALDRANDSD